MNILILNWRDPKSPHAGGAELLTYEMAKRWVAWDHQVTLFSAFFPGAKREEIISGIRIVRRGHWWSVHLWAFIYYWLWFKDVNVVIDEVHWYPFFSALYCRSKTVLLACEVARPLFYKLFWYPLALAGRAIEKFYFWLYRCIPVLAISPSTKADLVREGMFAKDITVLPMGVNVPANSSPKPKEAVPTLAYLGRIHPFKGVADVVKAFSLVEKQYSRCQLWIIGTGDKIYTEKIRQQISDLGLARSIKLFGYVEEKKKFELLRRAHLLLVPSMHEGWGLIVTEAAYQGTPAITYNVGGLRDSVQHNKTGVIVNQNTPEALAHETLALLNDPQRYRRLQQQGKIWARSSSWDSTAQVALDLMQSI